jgi:hypothetical protein
MRLMDDGRAELAALLAGTTARTGRDEVVVPIETAQAQPAHQRE